MGSDPLIETLFRSTAHVAQAASAAPVRPAGTRSRAGNAMNRTRAALLDGARLAVEASGTKITMAQVALSAGVAKATLYNHFRTREAVLSALLADEVDRLIAGHADRPLPEALAGAAAEISENPQLRALARHEPALLARLARIDLSQEAWRRAGDAVEALLAASDRAGTSTVLRWLASHLLTPSTHDEISTDVEILLAGLPPCRADEQSVPA